MSKHRQLQMSVVILWILLAANRRSVQYMLLMVDQHSVR